MDSDDPDGEHDDSARFGLGSGGGEGDSIDDDEDEGGEDGEDAGMEEDEDSDDAPPTTHVPTAYTSSGRARANANAAAAAASAAASAAAAAPDVAPPSAKRSKGARGQDRASLASSLVAAAGAAAAGAATAADASSSSLPPPPPAPASSSSALLYPGREAATAPLPDHEARAAATGGFYSLGLGSLAAASSSSCSLMRAGADYGQGHVAHGWAQPHHQQSPLVPSGGLLGGSYPLPSGFTSTSRSSTGYRLEGRGQSTDLFPINRAVKIPFVWNTE